LKSGDQRRATIAIGYHGKGMKVLQIGICARALSISLIFLSTFYRSNLVSHPEGLEGQRAFEREILPKDVISSDSIQDKK